MIRASALLLPAEDFALQLARTALPPWTREYRFQPLRRWRLDFAFIPEKIAVEVEGGTFVTGRHVRGVGVENDCEKYAEALCLGWAILRVTSRQVREGQALSWLQRILKGREDK